MIKHLLTLFIISQLFMTALAAPKELKPPSAEEVTLMENAAPAKATATPKKARKVLIVNQCEGFPHSSVPYGAKAFEILGRKTGAFSTVVVNDFSILEKPEFDSFDAIVMNNTTIRLPLLVDADEVREATAQKRFLDFIRNGKGLIGVHAATDCLYNWKEYGEIIGGYFDGHPWNEDVRVHLEDPGHPLSAAFKGLDFTVADEIYTFRNYSRSSLRVLMSLDVTKTNMKKDKIKRTDNDFAVAWIREYGQGHVFYFSLGHRHEIFWNPAVLQCYLDGIQYALGDLEADATPSSELSERYLKKSRAAGFKKGVQSILTELAAYKLSDNIDIAKQVDTFVDEHLMDNEDNLELLSEGLAALAANPQATLEGRAMACRKLSMVGCDNAIPTLAKLIDDAEMGNWARYALTRMPGKRVDKALVKALKRTKGNDQLAIAAMIGNRKISSAVSTLADIAEENGIAAATAAEAIGHIGGRSAVKELAKLQPRVSIRQAVDRALLNCADYERIDGSRSAASKAYALLLSAETAPHIRAAAFYGINISAGEKGAAAALTALKSTNTEMARAGALLIRDLPATDIAADAAAALKSMPRDNGIIAISALAARGDRSAQSGVLALVESDDLDIRIAALQALESLGDKQAVKCVMKIATDKESDRDLRKAASKTLGIMNGPGVDQKLIALMRSADVKAKAEYAKVLGTRKARSAMADLLTAARDADSALAGEARKAISLMARIKDLPVIVALLVDTTDVRGERYLENVIVKVSKSTDDETLKTDAVLKGLTQEIPVNARCSLLSTLGKMEVSSTLPILIAASKDKDSIIRRAALKVIAEDWQDAQPLQALRDASRKDSDEQCRVLAVSGYARMLTMPSNRPMKETLKLYREALDLVKGTKEKRALLTGLGSLVHRDALAFVTPYLKDKSVSAEAFQAALSITQGMNGDAIVLTSCVQGDEKNALDNNPKTRWTTGRSMKKGDWFMVDLGYEDTIKTIFLDSGPVGTDQPRGYEVYVSLDGTSWGKPVVKGDDPKKKAFTINCNNAYGRYIKIVQMGTSGGFWSINEIRINGIPKDDITYPALDRAGWKASASNSGGSEKPANAIDGDLTRRWGSGGAMKPEDWFAVDMGAEHTVHAVVMNAAKSGNDFPREYQIFTSMDGKDWYGPVGMGEGKGAVTTASILPTKTRHVKIVQTGTTEYNWWSIYDLQIMGE
jgi:type 1 glutamine amidotransferase